MNDEILGEIEEYESQLAAIRKELEVEENDELRNLETEIVSLINELKKNAPKFKIGDLVSSKAIFGKVIKSIGSRMYEVQPCDRRTGENRGDPEILNEDTLTTATLELKEELPPQPAHPAAKAENVKISEQKDDTFEQSKSKWKQFSRHKSTTKVKSASNNASDSRVSKPTRKRAHFTNKKII